MAVEDDAMSREETIGIMQRLSQSLGVAAETLASTCFYAVAGIVGSSTPPSVTRLESLEALQNFAACQRAAQLEDMGNRHWLHIFNGQRWQLVRQGSDWFLWNGSKKLSLDETAEVEIKIDDGCLIAAVDLDTVLADRQPVEQPQVAAPATIRVGPPTVGSAPELDEGEAPDGQDPEID